MAATATAPRRSHLELASRIIETARKRGLDKGARLPEQQFAELCNVSRTPVRAALRLLQQQGLVMRDAGTGYRLDVDLASTLPAAPALPAAPETALAETILRDRFARRLDDSVTAAELARRYRSSRQMVLKALKRLSDDAIVDRAPGQAWIFRPHQDGPDALAESYDFRLVVEPEAILSAGFALDRREAADLREATEALLALPDRGFDPAIFQQLDARFHGLIASSSGNRFLAEALLAHLRSRQRPGVAPGVGVFRLRQSAREHLAVLDQLEAGRMDLAADLMRVHLRLSRAQRPWAAGRGAPAHAGPVGRFG